MVLTTIFKVALLEVHGSVVPIQPGKPPIPVTAKFSLTPYRHPGPSFVTGTFTAPNVTEQKNNVTFWSSGEIPNQDLVFTLNVTSASPEYPFVFDWFFWEQPTAMPLTTTASSPPPYSNGLTLSASTTTASPAAASTSISPAPATQAHHPSHTGAIAGGVCGGVAAIIILVILWLWLKSRAKGLKRGVSAEGVVPFVAKIRRSHLWPSDEAVVHTMNAPGWDGVNPFLLPRDYNTASAALVPAEVAGPMTPGHAGLPSVPTASKSRLFAEDYSWPSLSRPTTDTAPSNSSHSQVNLDGQRRTQHMVQEVPPTYTPS